MSWRDFGWKLANTRLWSGKRPVDKLHAITSEPFTVGPIHWRRLASRPGWFIAFVKYDKRKADKS